MLPARRRLGHSEAADGVRAVAGCLLRAAGSKTGEGAMGEASDGRALKDRASGGRVSSGRTPRRRSGGGASRIPRAPNGTGRRVRERQVKFVSMLAETCSVTAAAQAAGVAVAICYRWRDENAAFAGAWDAAIAITYDRLEAGLLQHALATVKRAVGDDGAAGRGVSAADLQFAVGLLGRHRGGDEPKKSVVRAKPLPTRAETDAVLQRALDGLARRAKAH